MESETDMSKKRYISDDFWTDPYIEKLDLMEKGLFLYLLTNPLCNLAGIYEISLKRIAYETGLDVDMANIMLERFVRDDKLLRVDNWVIIINYAKHQVLNPNMEAGARRIFGELPEKVKALKGFERLPYLTLLNLTYREPLINQLKEPEEHKTNFKPPSKKKGKLVLANAKDVCQMFTESKGGSYTNTIHLAAIVELLQNHGIDKVKEVTEFALSLKPKQFQVKIDKPIDLADHWPKIIALMDMPEDKKDGWF